MASVGLSQEEMAGVLEVSVETLVKHFVAELATAAAAANEAVGKSLWLQAVGGPRWRWSRAPRRSLIARTRAAVARGDADADYLLIPTFREEDGEDRYKVIGMVDGKFWTAVHVRHGDTVRFISVRRSNDGEEKQYLA